MSQALPKKGLLANRDGPARQLTLYLFIFVFALLFSAVLVSVPYLTSAVVVVGVVVFILCFINVQASLYLLIFSMLLSPEIGAGGLGGGSTTTASRGVTIRAEDLLLLVIGFAWLVRMAINKNLGLVRQTPLNQPIFFYIMACFFSTGMGLMAGRVHGVTGFFYVLKYAEYFVIYFMIANNIQRRDQIKHFCAALIITAFIVACVAIAQIPSGERISAPFEGERGEPNTLGGYILFIACIVAGLALEMNREKMRPYLWALLGFLTIPFLFTLSRGSYLAAPFCYITMGLLYRAKRLKILFLMVVLGVVGTVALPTEVKDRVLYTVNQQFTQQERLEVGGVRLDTSTTERLRSWQKVFRDIPVSPIWGYGVTGYGFLDAQYPRILIETGFLGLVLFGMLIWSVFKLAFRVRRHSQDRLYRGLANGLIAGLVGLLFHGLSTNTFIIVRIMEPFWLVVGLVVCSEQLELKERATPHGNIGNDAKAA